mmetsp:Transcript_45042/g.119046  ORF Transcript_45042/g.119046 Transcript_45042/m.119046 type:complete len:122 (+) Transcript_45042:108-473(+)
MAPNLKTLDRNYYQRLIQLVDTNMPDHKKELPANLEGQRCIRVASTVKSSWQRPTATDVLRKIHPLCPCASGCLDFRLPVFPIACDCGCLQSRLPVIVAACNSDCLYFQLPLFLGITQPGQ